MSAPAPDPQFYLSHSGHVRRLARALVFDAHAAEDVEQETWLAALGHAPDDPRAARSWLRSIVLSFGVREAVGVVDCFMAGFLVAWG